ncbi:MAG: peptidylprolyl isomerase [Caulobacteraceae bacterium]
MRRSLAPAVIAAGLLALAACDRQPSQNAKPEPGDTAVATVAGETVWASDVKRQAVVQGAIGEGEPLDVSSDLFRRTLEEVIDQKLLAREAVRQKLDKSGVARRRLNAAREKLLGDMLVENVVDRAVNDNAIRALYQEQQRLSRPSEEIHARQIVLATQADADAVKKLLDTGASFEALAIQRSTDQATRFNGGDLGYFTLDSMPEAYGVALKEAKTGQLVGPFKTDAGYAVMKLEDRRAEQPIPLEEARPQIVRFLTYDEIRLLLSRLRGQTKVQVLVSQPAGAPGAPREPASATSNAVGLGKAPAGSPVGPAPSEGGAPAAPPASAATPPPKGGPSLKGPK